MNRRTFVKSSVAIGTLSFLPFRFGPFELLKASAGEFLADSPLRRLRGSESSTSQFTGDEIERTHAVLWDVDGYVKKQGGWPKPNETSSVVVIGGGMSGLSSAFALRDLKPIIFEQDSAFGGNSKGEVYGQSAYSIGAAYFMLPEAGTPTWHLLKDLKLEKAFRPEHGADTTVFFKNRFAKGFWQAATDTEAKPHFEKVFRRLEQLSGKVPEDPQLDAMSFVDWLKKEFGDVHPHLLEYFQLYCWSSFCASIEEISAAQMLEFIAAETGTLLACPGGNSLVASALHERLVQELGRDRVRSRCLVIDVRKEGENTIVTYVQPDGSLAAVQAKAVVFAAPKFVAKRIIRGLPDDQKRAMEMIPYRGYVVANIILNKPFQAPSYELYCLQGEVPEQPFPMKQSNRPFTDVVFGSWAQGDRTSNPVLTLYMGLARQFLFHEAAHGKYRSRMANGVLPVLEALGLNENDVKGIRMTRWGHSLPIAARGLIANGVVQKACEPLGKSVFFANQDNWANPSFETAVEAAAEAAAEVRKLF